MAIHKKVNGFILLACNRNKGTAAYLHLDSNVLVAVGGKLHGIVNCDGYCLGLH